MRVPIVGKYFRYYLIFRKYVGDQALFLGLISIFSTLTEGIGIAAFLAYLQFLASPRMPPSTVIEKMQLAFAFCHIPFSVGWVVSVLTAVFAVRGFLVLIGRGFQFRVHTRMLARVNDEVTSAISSMRYSDYLKRSAGFFNHVVTKEVWRTTTAFYQISAIIPIVVSITVYLLLSVRVDWRFTLLGAFFAGFIALLFRGVNYKTAKVSREMSSAEAQLSSLVIQLLHSFKYLFSTGSLEPLQQRVSLSADRVARAGSRIGYLSAILPASSETIIVAFLGTMVFFQTEVFGRSITPMLVAMMFLYRAMREATTLQGSWQTFNTHVGGVDVLTQTVAELKGNSEAAGGEKFKGIKRGIELRDVTFQYRDNPVLKNLSFSIPANSMVAFVGESGAGKSTLVDLITGLMPPKSGEILVDGTDYAVLDRNSLRAEIGYVTQESVVFDETVANNVSLWKWGNIPDGLARVENALAKANCMSFVSKFPAGVQELVGERGLRLSGGQRQRLSIARELFKTPALLILDEATSALDSESERQVQESVDALKGSTTIMMIAHRLATVRNCDLIYVLKDGVVVEIGTFDELKNSKGIFRRMCEAQSLA